MIIAKELAIEIFEKHYNAEKVIMDNDAAQKAALVTIDYMIEMLKYHGCDMGKYTLLDLTETKRQIKEL